jgi:exodeoxyribonuclease V alpha subunit
MLTLNDVHQQFAEYFAAPKLKSYAYLLSKRLSEGHICLPLDEPSDIEASGLSKGCALSAKVLKELSNEPLVSFDRQNKQPFVVYNNKMYLQRYFHYETVILERIQAIFK